MTYQKNKQIITIVRPVKKTKENIDLIWRCGNHRRFIWNQFVNEFKDRDIFTIKKKEVNKFAIKLHDIYEKKDAESGYKFYEDHKVTKGLIYYLSEKFKEHLATIKKHNPKGKFHFKKLDKYKTSFMVQNKINDLKKRPNLNPKLKIIESEKEDEHNKVDFMLYNGCHIEIELNENLYDEFIPCTREYKGKIIDCDNTTFIDNKRGYKFEMKDVVYFGFMYNLGKIYIMMQVHVQYKKKKYPKKEKAIGIHIGKDYPAIYYTGFGYMIHGLPDKEAKRVEKIDKRIRHLQSIMDYKMECNRRRFKEFKGLHPELSKEEEIYYRNKIIYSNQYERLRRKFRRSWQRKVDIITNYNHELSKWVAIKYERICLSMNKTNTLPAADNDANIREHSDIGLYKLHQYINYKSLRHGSTYILADDYVKYNELINIKDIPDENVVRLCYKIAKRPNSYKKRESYQ